MQTYYNDMVSRIIGSDQVNHLERQHESDIYSDRVFSLRSNLYSRRRYHMPMSYPYKKDQRELHWRTPFYSCREINWNSSPFYSCKLIANTTYKRRQSLVKKVDCQMNVSILLHALFYLQVMVKSLNEQFLLSNCLCCQTVVDLSSLAQQHIESK